VSGDITPFHTAKAKGKTVRRMPVFGKPRIYLILQLDFNAIIIPKEKKKKKKV